jgi:plastocyanin
MTKILIGVGAVALLGAGAFFFMQGVNQSTQEEIDKMEEEAMTQEEDGITEENGDVMEQGIVVYTDNGYSPSEITIKKGETVVFRNESSRVMWPATDIHPSHTLYPGSDIQKCFDGQSDISVLFDACGEIQPEEEWSFTFEESGTWKYHDHKRSSDTGTVTVEE